MIAKNSPQLDEQAPVSATLSFLLRSSAEAEPIEDLDRWWTRHVATGKALPTPLARAVGGGFVSDRLGYAFASGYQEALETLFPQPTIAMRSLAVTELEQPSRDSIRTVLRASEHGLSISGEKSFATLGQAAQSLLVAARRGEPIDGELAIVQVPTSRTGVGIFNGPTTEFAPEIPHARVVLDDVRIMPAEVLDGDAYERYLRPFAVVEDCFVHAATLGFLFRLARLWSWPDVLGDRILTSIIALFSVEESRHADRALALIALGSVLAAGGETLRDLDANRCWDQVDELTRARWLRDRNLLRVGSAARRKRLARARELVGGSPTPP